MFRKLQFTPGADRGRSYLLADYMNVFTMTHIFTCFLTSQNSFYVLLHPDVLAPSAIGPGASHPDDGCVHNKGSELNNQRCYCPCLKIKSLKVSKQIRNILSQMICNLHGETCSLNLGRFFSVSLLSNHYCFSSSADLFKRSRV